MNTTDVIVMLRAADPLPESVARELDLTGGERDLLDRIVAHAAGSERQPRRAPSRVRRPIVLALAAAVATVSVLAGFSLNGGSGGPSPAFAAALVRFANSTPLVLLQLPGWHVTYVQQQTDGYGEIHFVHGPARADGDPVGPSTESALAGRFVQVTWTPITARARAYPQLGGHQHLPTGLGVPATRFVTEGRSRHWIDLTTMFVYGNRIFSFRATTTTMAAYQVELNALHKVSATTWLQAMPASVIKTANTAAVRRTGFHGDVC